MIGQNRLVDLINSYEDIPHSLLLLGEKGCGKHLLVKMISNKLNVEYENVTDSLTTDFISDLSIINKRTMIVIDVDKIGEKEQNALLKVVEEPSELLYIAICCNNILNVIDTLKNRCTQLVFDSYKKEDLEQFTKVNSNKDLLLDLCTTPGQVIEYDNIDLSNVDNLCGSIIKSIRIATLPNTLSILLKIGFGKDENKIPLELFIKLFKYRLFEGIKEKSSKLLESFYEETEKLDKTLKDERLSKEKAFENYLIKLWKVAR